MCQLSRTSAACREIKQARQDASNRCIPYLSTAGTEHKYVVPLVHRRTELT